MSIKITLELEPEAAAGLKRFAEKISHEQAYQIMAAFNALDRALDDAHVRGWPWVETGRHGH